jgi:hypothetical protein
MKAGKQRVIVKILGSDRLKPDLSSTDSINVQKSILTGLKGITSNKENRLSREVKTELLQYLFKLFVCCELHLQSNDDPDSPQGKVVLDIEESALEVLINILKVEFQYFEVDES